jgi:hypothetical protein
MHIYSFKSKNDLVIFACIVTTDLYWSSQLYLFIYLDQFIGPCPSGGVRMGLKVPCEALPRYKL